HLPPMVAVSEDPRGTGYAVSVSARNGITTGISAADRARTISLLADPDTQSTDLSRPGHVFPLRAVDGGVLRRAERLVECKARSRLPTEHGEFQAYGFRSVLDGREHIALVMGDLAGHGLSP